jgi:hypothetical protein
LSRVAILTPAPADAVKWGELPGEIYERMAAPLSGAGLDVRPEPWTRVAPEALAGYDLVLPLLVWGYHFDIARFRAAAGRWAEAGARLRNPAPVLMWNCDKRYLEVLAAHGAPVIPTLFVDRLGPADLTRAADAFGAEALVVKPQVSAAAWKTLRLAPGAPLEDAPEGPAMIQPFLPAIGEEGELSLFLLLTSTAASATPCASAPARATSGCRRSSAGSTRPAIPPPRRSPRLKRSWRRWPSPCSTPAST